MRQPSASVIPASSAATVVSAVLDGGRLDRWNGDSGAEAVLTGRASVGGHEVVVLISDFPSHGGSIGLVAAHDIESAVRRATRLHLPLLAFTASGGTRISDGTLAFLQMARLTAAVEDHKRAGLPYISYLGNPTSGGVLASWASLAHVVFGEPEAFVGLLGRRAQRAIGGREIPRDVQRSEHLASHGVLDAVVPVARLGGLLDSTLDLLAPRTSVAPTNGSRSPVVARSRPAPSADRAARARIGVVAGSSWRSVCATRDERRPGAVELLEIAVPELVWLRHAPLRHGGRQLRTAVGRFGPHPAVVIAQDRHAPGQANGLAPGAFRTARRAMALAEQLGLPLVSLIDTGGAALTAEAEEEGLSAEIAETLARWLSVRACTISVLLGQGTGAAALALFPAQRVIASANAWLAPLAPEGASAIVHRTPDQAASVIEDMGAAAPILAGQGQVDVVIDEPADLRADVSDYAGRVVDAVATAIAELTG